MIQCWRLIFLTHCFYPVPCLVYFRGRVGVFPISPEPVTSRRCLALEARLDESEVDHAPLTLRVRPVHLDLYDMCFICILIPRLNLEPCSQIPLMCLASGLPALPSGIPVPGHKADCQLMLTHAALLVGDNRFLHPGPGGREEALA